MERLSQMRLAQALSIAAGVPLVFALCFCVILMGERWLQYRQTQTLSELADVAMGLGDLIYDQQRERGATSVFLNSQGTTFTAELKTYRRQTDDNMAQVLAMFEGLDGVAKDGPLIAEIDSFIAELGRMGAVRAQVNSAAIPPASAVDYYTGLNRQVLDLIHHIAQRGQGTDIALRMESFANLLEASEASGLERAVGSGAFAAGRIDLPTLLRLQTLIARQDSSLALFRTNATAAQIASLDAWSGSPAIGEVTRLRDVATEALGKGVPKGMTGQDFFTAKTAQIDGLKGIQDQVAVGIAYDLQGLLGNSLQGLLLMAFITITGLGLSVWLVMRLAQVIAAAIARVEHCARAMAAGDLDIALPPAPENEVGTIIRALDSFRCSIQAAQQHAAEMATAKALAEAKTAQQARAEADREAALHTEKLRATEARHRLEQAAAQEISAVVQSCARGDFSQRVALEGKEGVLRSLAEGLNQVGTTANLGLQDVRSTVVALAKGDLTQRMTGAHDGVFAEIADAVNDMAISIADTIGQIRTSTTTVDASSDEIARAADDLARRSENNAATLEQTVAALEEMAISIRRSANSAVQARTTAQEISLQAGAGTEVVSAAIHAMGKIEESSNSMAGIITLIEEIALQTSLLALNASVEAARAGEAGRAFALVASEVRALAARASGAAKDISELIGKSRDHVTEGVALVNSTGAVLGDIAKGVQDIVRTIDQIANAANETSAGVGELTNAATELDRATQRNAAMFEETNAAVQTLRGEAQQLTATVGVFKVDGARDVFNSRRAALRAGRAA